MKHLPISALTLATLALSACSTQQQASTRDSVLVCISQITSHPVFDDVVQGIKNGFKAANINATYDLQNAQGDSTVNQSIAQKFANGDCDLVMPLGTPSSQAVVNLIKTTPIVFGGVTDPVAAELVPSLDHPGANVTGTSDITLYNEQLDLLKKLVPEAKTIGIVYNPGEANSRSGLAQTEALAASKDLTIVTAPATNGAEIISAAQSLAGTIDAYFMLPDNTVLAGQEALISVALDSKKPLIAIDQSGVEKGALATLGTNYVMVGTRTAEVAVRVLNGEDPGSIPVLGVTDADVFLNATTADDIGIQLPQDLMDSAKHVYR